MDRRSLALFLQLAPHPDVRGGAAGEEKDEDGDGGQGTEEQHSEEHGEAPVALPLLACVFRGVGYHAGEAFVFVGVAVQGLVKTVEATSETVVQLVGRFGGRAQLSQAPARGVKAARCSIVMLLDMLGEQLGDVFTRALGQAAPAFRVGLREEFVRIVLGVELLCCLENPAQAHLRSAARVPP